MINPGWLSVEDASRLTGYHPEHIRRLIRQGAIRAQLVGLMYFINLGSLREYLEEGKRTNDGRFGPRN